MIVNYKVNYNSAVKMCRLGTIDSQYKTDALTKYIGHPTANEGRIILLIYCIMTQASHIMFESVFVMITYSSSWQTSRWNEFMLGGLNPYQLGVLPAWVHFINIDTHQTQLNIVS